MPAPRPEQRQKSKPAVSVKARAAFLEALAAGWSVTHAAQRAGVARQRLYERRDADEHLPLAGRRRCSRAPRHWRTRPAGAP
jgi:hypothetical protein